MINTKLSSLALILHRGKLLLFLRDNYSFIPNPNTWSLVGGEVEKDESFEQAIKREMNEEISVVPADTVYLGKIQTPDGNLHAIFLVKPTTEEVKKIKLGNEGQKVEFFSFDEIKNLDLSINIKIYFGLYGGYLEEILKSNKPVDPKKLGLI